VRPTEFVESYFDAWNHCDPKGVAEHLTADGIYCDVPENAQRSKDELITNLTEFFSTYRQRYELIGEIMAGENSLAFQYQFYPIGGRHGSDQQAPLRGAEFMTLHGDAAVTITDYYDVPGVARPSRLSLITERRSRQHKYAKSGLDTGQLQTYKERLLKIMRDDRAYLQSDLTLPRLAGTVDCSVNHLSQVINSGFGMSFFDFLNQHRIAHAKELLTQLDDKSGAILNVAFTVGFNSNSAFYAAFKKCVGQTPAQYRRAHMRNSQ
jgi:AraC-like DNA-binding protein